MNRWLAPALSVAVLSAGCGPQFDSPSKIASLRVLAVEKDKPYARPGDTVKLSMLLADGSKKAGREINVIWVAACENPLGDLYAGCAAPDAASKSPAVAPGLDFSFKISDDIISRRPPPVDRKQPPYGLAIVFFAACAGTVGTDLEGEFPITCKSASGEPLGAEDFVAGYTQIFAYDAFENANPIVTGFEVDGEKVVPECIGHACVELQAKELGGGGLILPGGPDGGSATDAGAADAATDGGPADGGPADGGAASPGGPTLQNPCGTSGKWISKSPACFKVCEKKDSDTCPKHKVKLLADRASAEHNTAVEAREGKTNLEQMWINYYAEGARFPGSDVKLLNDATAGWHEDHDTDLLEPKKEGPITLWAVAHDNRGGASWLRVKLEARPGPTR